MGIFGTIRKVAEKVGDTLISTGTKVFKKITGDPSTSSTGGGILSGSSGGSGTGSFGGDLGTGFTSTGGTTTTSGGGGGGGTVAPTTTTQTTSIGGTTTGGLTAAISQRTGTAKTQELPPIKQEPIRHIDIGSRDSDRIGGVTFRGREAQGGRVKLRKTGETVEVEIQRTQTSDPSALFIEQEPKKKGVVGKSFDFLFGSESAVVVSRHDPVSLLTTSFKERGTKDLTLTDIKDVYRTGGLPGKVVAEVFVPSSYGEAALFVGVGGVYGKLPTILRTGASAVIGYSGVKGALDVTSPTETRIASGIVGGLGFAGTIFESTPFIKGQFSKLSPMFKRVSAQPEGFLAVERVKLPPKPSGKVTDRVGLILEEAPAKTGATAGVQLPKESPLVKGGFGRRPGGEQIFIGKDQLLGTSQRGLFKQGEDILLEKEFFVTPQEPFIKIPETRVSRLGIQDPFEIPKSPELGFGFPEQAQIGITLGSVGRRETATQFILGTGTELEAIKTRGIITDVQRIGVTTIKGQAVDIFSFRVGSGAPGQSNIFSQSTEGITRVSGESVLSVTGSLRSGRTTPLSPTSQLGTTSSGLVIDTFTIPTRTGATPPPSRPISPRTTIPTSPIVPTITTPPLSPPISPPFSPPRTPPRSPPVRPPFIPPFSPPIPSARLYEKLIPPQLRSRQPFRYTPSISGLVLGIRTRPEFILGGFLPIGSGLRGSPRFKRRKRFNWLGI